MKLKIKVKEKKILKAAFRTGKLVNFFLLSCYTHTSYANSVLLNYLYTYVNT